MARKSRKSVRKSPHSVRKSPRKSPRSARKSVRRSPRKSARKYHGMFGGNRAQVGRIVGSQMGRTYF